MNATPITDFSKIPVRPPPVLVVVDVWLEAGRDGRTFTYCDRKQLNVRLGDLVQVSLRGRRIQGLVTACRTQNPRIKIVRSSLWMLFFKRLLSEKPGDRGLRRWRSVVTPARFEC